MNARHANGSCAGRNFQQWIAKLGKGCLCPGGIGVGTALCLNPVPVVGI